MQCYHANFYAHCDKVKVNKQQNSNDLPKSKSLFQAVKPLEYTGIAVMNDVKHTAETMYATYRRELVLDVNQDGRAQFVIQV